MKDKIGKHDLWEYEIALWTERGLDPDEARFATIGRWMCNNKLRPLAAAIRKGQVDGAILSLLADLIDDGRLTVKPLKRDAPKKPGRPSTRNPGIYPRNVAAFYLRDRRKKSEEEIADILGMTKQSVHQAIIAVRKALRAVK
jgi:hypothetical protein